MDSLLVMVQEEAADRLVRSEPGSPDYRAMSVRVGFYCGGSLSERGGGNKRREGGETAREGGGNAREGEEGLGRRAERDDADVEGEETSRGGPAVLLRVPRRAFFPAPRVDSAVVRFPLRRGADLVPVGRPPREFFSLVNQAFSSRRKMLRNNLQGTAWGEAEVADALAAAGLAANARAQDLSAADFAALSRALGEPAGGGGVGAGVAGGGETTRAQPRETG